MRLLKWWMLMGFAIALVSGCARHAQKGDQTALLESPGASAQGLGGPEGAAAQPLGGAEGVGRPDGGFGANGGGQFGGIGGAGGGAVIYFVYDSDEVQPQYVQTINTIAQSLLADPSKRVSLEGSTDERGSAEYNIALGERRAQNVARLMKLQGVSDGQVQVISYGEEKPAAFGHDESAYQLNRRVEFH